MPKVSFILPAYKRRFLREAITSILAQTYRDFELVVVDDCSPEDLKSVADEFHDGRLSYHRNAANIGGKDLVAAWNHAMEYATGEWCVLASDDDVYMPRYLEALVRLQGRYPSCDLFHSRLAVIDENGVWKHIGDERIEYESCIQMVYARGVRRMSQMAPDFLFRTNALKKIGGFISFPRAWYSDDATWMSLARNGCVCSQEVLFAFRQSGYNISTQYENLLEKQCAAGQYKRWVSQYIQTLVPKTQEEVVLMRELAAQIHREVDKLCRWEMDQSGCVAWLKNYLRSPANRTLKRRFLVDFGMRPFVALRAKVGSVLLKR